MSIAEQTLNLKLVSSENGFEDYDVVDHPVLRRVCVPNGIRKGQHFNVYHSESSKSGAKWLGSLERSLTKWLEQEQANAGEAESAYDAA